MDSIVFLIFRRMRLPLILLIVTYTISIIGLILIPGIDDKGQVWHMDFFHAFYFVSFMATTIGFGEIPYEFTDPQRLWVLFTLYATVIVWFYAIGNVLSLVQNAAFQEALTRARFARKMCAIRQPFYLICGYGDVGEILLQELSEQHYRAVVIEKDETRVHALKLASLPEEVPILHADAAASRHLLEAGLNHPYCQAVVALTNDDKVNLKVSISSKALRPEIKVICRAESTEIEENMASFGTDHIIDPFDTFAIHLSTAITTPCLYLLQNWLNSGVSQVLKDPIYPPVKGVWLICGFGRFGKAVYARLKAENIKVIIIEARPELTGKPNENETFILGAGTNVSTLKEAKIEDAVGLVAGTNDDVNNLSIVMTAKLLNPTLFVVMRQNQSRNTTIIHSAKADMIMESGEILANKVRNLLAYPLLDRFIGLAFFQENNWACELASRIAGITNQNTPHVWSIKINQIEACAVADALILYKPIRVGHLLLDYRDRNKKMPCIPLLLVRENSYDLLPKDDKKLKIGDQLLFCAEEKIHFKMEWILLNYQVLEYILTGKYSSQSWLWRKIEKKWG